MLFEADRERFQRGYIRRDNIARPRVIEVWWPSVRSIELERRKAGDSPPTTGVSIPMCTQTLSCETCSLHGWQ